MVQAHRLKAIALVGCTAVGKSDIAIKLAKRFNGEIIGADSMQIYKHFDIGTGKLLPNERGDVPHHLIDIADADSEFSVGEYVRLAAQLVADISSRGKLPLIVGGTGLYVNSLFSGCNFADVPKNDGVRKALRLFTHMFGAAYLHKILEELDCVSAARIAVNDVKRTIRAIEICVLRGRAKSEAVETERPYDDMTIVLTLPRELLYGKINARVHRMFADGLIEEALGLMRYKGSQAMQALGYKQIAEAPNASSEELEATVAQKTRNYAKRQMTYFNNMKLNKVFIDVRDYAAIERAVAGFIGE